MSMKNDGATKKPRDVPRVVVEIFLAQRNLEEQPASEELNSHDMRKLLFPQKLPRDFVSNAIYNWPEVGIRLGTRKKKKKKTEKERVLSPKEKSQALTIKVRNL